MGVGIGIEYYQPDANQPGLGIAAGAIYSRTFNASGAQTGFSGAGQWDGGATPNQAAGYFVEGNGINMTALYIQNQGSTTLYVPALEIQGWTSNGYDAGNAPIVPGYNHLSYPGGWWIVGALGNGTVAPPWQ